MSDSADNLAFLWLDTERALWANADHPDRQWLDAKLADASASVIGADGSEGVIAMRSSAHALDVGRAACRRFGERLRGALAFRADLSAPVAESFESLRQRAALVSASVKAPGHLVVASSIAGSSSMDGVPLMPLGHCIHEQPPLELAITPPLQREWSILSLDVALTHAFLERDSGDSTRRDEIEAAVHQIVREQLGFCLRLPSRPWTFIYHSPHEAFMMLRSLHHKEHPHGIRLGIAVHHGPIHYWAAQPGGLVLSELDRLVRMTRHDILLSRAFLEALAPSGRYQLSSESLDPIPVKGSSKTLEALRLLAIRERPMRVNPPAPVLSDELRGLLEKPDK